MKYEESYQGRPIVVVTERSEDGSWSFHAELPDGKSAISITNDSNEVFPSEEAARRAALSAAAATIDRARASRGKP